MFSHQRALFAGSALIALALAPAAWAQNAYDFNLPAQAMADSLRAVGRQTGVNVAFAPSAVAGRQAPALRGAYSPQDALARLVDGSGLQLKHSSANTFLVEVSGPQGDGQAETERPTAVEELVVTAEKRPVNIQAVPVSVSAISGARMTALGLRRLNDYSQYVPGLVINDSGTPGQAAVTLRGIAPIGAGSMVGYYIDDTPLGSSGNWAVASSLPLDLMPYDVDQFEVLRGPQGTLYGAGAMGGLIKYMLKPADPNRFSGQVGGELNYTDHSSGLGSVERAAINIPLIEGKLAIRASIYDQQYQGYVDNVRLGESNSNDGYQRGGRIAVTFKPVDNFRVNLNALINRTRFDDGAIVRLGNITTHVDDGVTVYSGTPVAGPLGHADAYDQPFSKDIDYYSGTINWDLGPLTAVSATSYSRTRTHRQSDVSDTYGVYPAAFGMAPGVGKFDFDLGLDKFTQELRLVSPTGGKVEWLVGAFYTHENSTDRQLVHVYDANYQPITGPFAAYFNPFFASVDVPTTYEEYAAFGDLTVHLTDRFDVTGGLRWAHNDQKTEQINQGLAIGGFTDTPGASSESVATWQANARYRFNEEVMAYARVATGYRPGGPNGSLGAPIPSVDSDRLTSYEAGVKSTFLDGRALLNISVFDIQWKGIQLGVSSVACGCSYLANGGDAYSRGFELEGSIAPVEGLRIGYNAAYTKGALTSLLPGAPTFLLGYQLPYVPKFTGAVNADYGWALRGDWRASVGGGVHYVGEAWTASPGVGFTTKNAAYATADLRAGLSNDRYSINLFVHNVTDKLVYLQQAPLQNLLTGALTALNATPLQPRVVGISFDATF